MNQLKIKLLKKMTKTKKEKTRLIIYLMSLFFILLYIALVKPNSFDI